MTDQTEREDFAKLLVKQFIDQGKLLEFGFEMFAKTVMHPQAPQLQHDEMKFAFMAGAHYLFATLINILDPDREPTDEDSRRMDLICEEIKAWQDKMNFRLSRTEGNA